MRVKRREPALGEDLTLFHLARGRELKEIRRELRRLEWRSRWARFKHWIKL